MFATTNHVYYRLAHLTGAFTFNIIAFDFQCYILSSIIRKTSNYIYIYFYIYYICTIYILYIYIYIYYIYTYIHQTIYIYIYIYIYMLHPFHLKRFNKQYRKYKPVRITQNEHLLEFRNYPKT